MLFKISEQATRYRKTVVQRIATTLNAARLCDVQFFHEDAHCSHYADNFYSNTCQYCKSFMWPAELESTCWNKGQVILPYVLPPPTNIMKLYNTIKSGHHFLKNIVAYNNLLALASIGYKDPNDSVRGFCSTIKIQVKMYHKIGTLVPCDGQLPQFAQIYSIIKIMNYRAAWTLCRTSVKILSKACRRNYTNSTATFVPSRKPLN